MPTEPRSTAASASQESLCCVRSLQTLQCVCGTGGTEEVPGGTHTWEVIESEEMAQGEKRGAQTAGISFPHIWKRRHEYRTLRISCFLLPWSWAGDYSMLINVPHMYICSLSCKNSKWHLETPSPFKRTLIHHIIPTPRWQGATSIFAFEHFPFHLQCILMHFSAHSYSTPLTHMYANITLFHKMKSFKCTHYTNCSLLLEPRCKKKKI